MTKQIIRKKIDSKFGLENSYDRFEYYCFLTPMMNDAEYWHFLGYCYSQSDDLYNLRDVVKRAFLSTRPYRHMLMTSKERRFLINLPAKFTIYRGMTREEYDSGDFGISWTLDQEQGHFFAHTYIRNHATANMPKVVARATVKKSCVVAYFEGSEQELIVIPKKDGDLTDVGVVEEESLESLSAPHSQKTENPALYIAAWIRNKPASRLIIHLNKERHPIAEVPPNIESVV